MTKKIFYGLLALGLIILPLSNKVNANTFISSIQAQENTESIDQGCKYFRGALENLFKSEIKNATNEIKKQQAKETYLKLVSLNDTDFWLLLNFYFKQQADIKNQKPEYYQLVNKWQGITYVCFRNANNKN